MAKVTLSITFDPQTKGTTVTGPIEDKMLCYAMLEIARDSIKDFKPAEIQTVPSLAAVFPALNGAAR